MKTTIKNPSVRIICPLFNAEQYIDDLHPSLMKQKGIKAHIHYIITRSTDQTIEKVKKLSSCTFKVIEPKDFSHSLTRENAIKESTEDIIVFISQDVIIKSTNWLKNLVTPIIEGKCEATFSRQICDNPKSIEKYIRNFNYPSKSYFSTKSDITKKGLQTFFFSDASSALKRTTFLELGGYDQKLLPTNEDMYYAHKLITSGYTIKYCADSVVYHYHNFTIKQQFQRYYAIGQFLKQNPEISRHKITPAGTSLASYILKNALKDRNIKVLLNYFPNLITRFLGLKLGKRNHD